MTKRYTDVIAAFSMFDGYTSYGLDVLLERGVIAELAAGQALYKEGDPADFVALIISGKVDLYVESETGEQPLPSAGPSRLLGELAVLAAANRVMSARAAEPTVVLKWDADAFRRLLGSDAELSQRMFRETFRSIVEERQSLVSSLTALRASNER